MRSQRSRIPIPEEGRTVAAPYEGGAATLTATFFRFLPLFLNSMPFFFQEWLQTLWKPVLQHFPRFWKCKAVPIPEEYAKL